MDNMRMVIGFTGWMDGGEVSSGAIDWLASRLGAELISRVDTTASHLFSFPGSMEVASLFRPEVKIADGLVEAYYPPENTYRCSREHGVLLFKGHEPNFNWDAFAERMFAYARECGVELIVFVGSYSGAVPHTREPRIFCAASDAELKSDLANFGLRPACYEGPASFSTHLLAQARQQGFRMASIVAEIPAYIQGANPKGIEAVVRKLAAILGADLGLEDLRPVTDEWEKRIASVLAERAELAEFVHKLETDYDAEIFETQMGDLKDWLQEKGIRVD